MLIAVFLPILSDVAAVGSHSVQPRAVDPHAGRGAGAPVLLPGHRLPGGRAHIRQRAPRQHRAADRAHAQVLLLGGEPESQERHHA